MKKDFVVLWKDSMKGWKTQRSRPMTEDEAYSYKNDIMSESDSIEAWVETREDSAKEVTKRRGNIYQVNF